MSAAIKTAFVGDEVELVVDVAHPPPGHAVQFDVRDDQQALLARLFADVVSGSARAAWVVTVGTRTPPVALRFTASICEREADAGLLTVVRPDTLSTPAWIVDAKATAGPKADAVIEEEDDPKPDLAAGAAFDPARLREAGQRVTLRVEVGDSEGYTITNAFDILFERFALDADGRRQGASAETLPFHLTPKQAARAVRLHWTVPEDLPTAQLVFQVTLNAKAAG